METMKKSISGKIQLSLLKNNKQIQFISISINWFIFYLFKTLLVLNILSITIAVSKPEKSSSSVCSHNSENYSYDTPV